jgi:hypothetical protein
VDALVEAATKGDEETELVGVDFLLTAEWGERFDTLLPEEQQGDALNPKP